jgi:hypothetical protein
MCSVFRLAAADRTQYLNIQLELQRAVASFGAQTTEIESERLTHQRYREAAESAEQSLRELCSRLEQRAVRAEGEAAIAIAAERDGRMRWTLDRRRIAVSIVCDFHARRRANGLKRGFMRWRRVSREESMRLEYSRRETSLRAELLAAYSSQLDDERRTAEARLLQASQATARVTASRDALAEERFGLKRAAGGRGVLGALLHWRVEQLSRKVRSQFDPRMLRVLFIFMSVCASPCCIQFTNRCLWRLRKFN